jgi:hypothetical protein
MASTPLTPATFDGATPGSVVADPAGTAADTVNGNSCPNSGMTFLRVKNNDTAPHTLTLITPGTVDNSLAVADDPRVIPASTTKWIPRLPVSVYGSTLQMTADSAQLLVTAFEP